MSNANRPNLQRMPRISQSHRARAVPPVPTQARTPAPRSRSRNGLRLRNGVFTLNNPDEKSASNIKRVYPNKVSYCIFQREIAPTTGTRHYQGYFELVKQTAISTIKTWNSDWHRMNIKPRRGTQQQAIDYCSKEDSRAPNTHPEVVGEPRGNALSPDFIDAMMDGATKKELQLEWPQQYLLHTSKIDKFRENLIEPRNHQMDIVIYVGDTGTGKSFCANSLYPDAYYGSWPMGGRWWWPNYDGEHTVILDEFRHQIPYHSMLKLLDRYPWKIEFKGGNREFNSRRVIITTNIHPKDWYPRVRDRAPLIRRINEYSQIWNFGPLHDTHEGEDDDSEDEGEIDDLDEFHMWRKINREQDLQTIPIPEVQERIHGGGWTYHIPTTTRTDTDATRDPEPDPEVQGEATESIADIIANLHK